MFYIYIYIYIYIFFFFFHLDWLQIFCYTYFLFLLSSLLCIFLFPLFLQLFCKISWKFSTFLLEVFHWSLNDNMSPHLSGSLNILTETQKCCTFDGPISSSELQFLHYVLQTVSPALIQRFSRLFPVLQQWFIQLSRKFSIISSIHWLIANTYPGLLFISFFGQLGNRNQLFSMFILQLWTAIDRLSTIWKSDIW